MNLEKEIETQLGEELDVTLAPAYVTNAFTKTEEKVNLEVDHANIACLTSKNNKFSLDEEGNLVVNSLTCNANTGTNILSILDVYPVGSIYLSINEMNPSNFFGGSWELFSQGRCLVGVDSTQEEFDTVEKIGGEKVHTLLVEEMPKHVHDVRIYDSGSANVYRAPIWQRTNAQATYSDSSGAMFEAGKGQSHNNLQPYMTCYMWKRVA